jgi:hypothetical protein
MIYLHQLVILVFGVDGGLADVEDLVWSGLLFRGAMAWPIHVISPEGIIDCCIPAAT